MPTKIIFRILYLDQDEGILVLLDEYSSFPFTEIFENLEQEVYSKIAELVNFDPESFWRRKIFSDIVSDNSVVSVTFNFMLESKSWSKFPLVKYNRNSIELHRFINQNRG